MGKTLSNQATDWREGRRLRAFELKHQGWKQREIADALGVSKGAVSQW
ncbi:MAG: helix-turn-helix domain-containing protein, partial [Actinobacteria bacterium]|nr:helix-turn-helix domain-containing protein [Actinomycetota bacterium]